MKNTCIYVMTHKSFQQSLPQEYSALQVGAALNDTLGYLSDNQGDNISRKNCNYCELTGLYWLWKNSDAEVVGLCHYRRYLSKVPFDRKLKHIYTKSDIAKKLSKCDIILPYPTYTRLSNKEHYCTSHYARDYQLTRDAIEAVTPEYLGAFDKFMEKHYRSECNMFIASKELTNSYCDWLFSIYAELEKKIDLSEYSPYQARMYGFMSERLLNVWVEHNKLSKAYAFFASTEVNYKKAILDFVSQIFSRTQVEKK